MPHPFLDARSAGPKTADLKAHGMARRIRTVQRAAKALPPHGPLDTGQIAGFLGRLEGYDWDRMALVGHMLARIGHIALLDALHRHGMAWWDTATSVRLLLGLHPQRSHDKAHHAALWAFAQAHGHAPLILAHAQGTQTLPLDGWLWLARQAEGDPIGALRLLRAPSLDSSRLAGHPSITTPAQAQAYGGAVARLFQALHAHAGLPRAPFSTAGTGAATLMDIEDLAVAALSGWPLEGLVARAQAILSHAEPHHGWIWAEATSAHARLTLARKMAALDTPARHALIAKAHLSRPHRRLHGQFPSTDAFARDPELRALFVAPHHTPTRRSSPHPAP